MQSELYKSLLAFNHQIAKEMLEHSNSYWLVVRSFFNYLMLAFVTSYLMVSFESSCSSLES